MPLTRVFTCATDATVADTGEARFAECLSRFAERPKIQRSVNRKHGARVVGRLARTQRLTFHHQVVTSVFFQDSVNVLQIQARGILGRVPQPTSSIEL